MTGEVFIIRNFFVYFIIRYLFVYFKIQNGERSGDTTANDATGIILPPKEEYIYYIYYIYHIYIYIYIYIYVCVCVCVCVCVYQTPSHEAR